MIEFNAGSEVPILKVAFGGGQKRCLSVVGITKALLYKLEHIIAINKFMRRVNNPVFGLCSALFYSSN